MKPVLPVTYSFNDLSCDNENNKIIGYPSDRRKQGPMLGVCFEIYVHLVIRCQLKELAVFYHTFLYIISLRF